MSGVQIIVESPGDPGLWEQYASIPIAFTVTSRLVVTAIENGLGGLRLTEEPVIPPYVKDYDAIEGEGPTHWPRTFDLSPWGILAAFEDSRRVGGAAVAWHTPGVEIGEGRSDRAILWDLRVDPAYRGQGIGRRLFEAAMEWARERGCRELIVETQNINVPACRFYARQGCELLMIRQHAYPTLPDEVLLLWSRQL